MQLRIPATGPEKAAAAKTQTPYALSIGFQISARAPPMTASGDEAAKPPKNLPSIIVSTFRARATGIWKIAKHR